MDKRKKMPFVIVARKTENSKLGINENQDNLHKIQEIGQVDKFNNADVQNWINKIIYFIKTHYYQSESFKSIKLLNSIARDFLEKNKHFLYSIMKIVLYDKIKSETLCEIKKFYDEEFYPVLVSTHSFCSNDYNHSREINIKDQKLKFIIENPNLLRSYKYMVKSEEYLHNFLKCFEKKLGDFVKNSDLVNDEVNDYPSDLEDEIISEIETSFILNFEKKISFESRNNLNNQLDPLKDRSSNFHVNKKEYVPKTRKEMQTLKEKIPLLKNFSPSYTKRTNIDKKIIRKFRIFLKSRYENNNDTNLKIFWIKFIKENLFPPMKMYDNDMKKNVEFKSFNTKYLIWLFSKEGACEYYEEFLKNEGKNIIDLIIIKYELNQKDQESHIKNEVEKLQFYIAHLAEVFNSFSEENSDLKEFSEAKSYKEENYKNIINKDKNIIIESIGAAPVNQSSCEYIYENYLGQDFDIKLEKVDIFKMYPNKLMSYRYKNKINKKNDETESSDASLERSRKLEHRFTLDYNLNSHSASEE